MLPHPPSPMADDAPSVASYPSDYDDNSYDRDVAIDVITPPPPSPSCPSTPQDVHMACDPFIDAPVDDDEDRPSLRYPHKQRALQLAPISNASHKDVTLPPVQDLLAHSCHDCEQERSRRATWDYEHSRMHPRHLYAGEDGTVLQPSPAQERLTAAPLDARRHSVHGPLSASHQFYYSYPSSPSPASRPRYASHNPSWARVHNASPVYDPRVGPSGVDYDHPRFRPDVDFAEYTLSSHPHGHAYLHSEPPIDPRDAAYGLHTPEDRRLPPSQSWRRTHVDSGRYYATPQRAPDDEVALSSPDLPLAHPHHPHPHLHAPQPQRRSSFPHQPYPSSHPSHTPAQTRRAPSVQPRRRMPAQAKAPPPAQPPPLPRERAPSIQLPPPPKRESSEPSDHATPVSTSSDDAQPTTPTDLAPRMPAGRQLSKLPPFTDQQITMLGEQYLLAMHPKRTQILCRWDGGCSRYVHEPLTANIVAHLQAHHGVCARERSEELVQCRWGDKCGRTLKACSIRNHILNCHEKAKTGECRLCGSLISRAEAYLMHRHLTSCLSKIAREGDLEARLRAAGVVIDRDPQTGAVRFTRAPGTAAVGAVAIAAVREDSYDELEEDA